MLDGRKPPTRFIVSATALSLLIVFGGARLAQAVIPTSIEGVGSGTIVIGTQSYEFVPTDCFISDEGFVVAGTGHNGSDRFWVSASSADLDFSVGTERPTDLPTKDQQWLVSTSALEWTSDGHSIAASTVVTDKRRPGAAQHDSRLELICDDPKA